ncbi:unnamed protein product [Pleuronectes platessa]|uniref:Uncharacterized protein n=1 Tax=Pleuronectes platessa TaxID=8262 RepID=A0A9N7YIH9_PLEPL|nr:unnamed protein product [Pleuronectes platessa]
MRYTFQVRSSEVDNHDSSLQSREGFGTFLLDAGPDSYTPAKFNAASPISRSSCEPTGSCDGQSVVWERDSKSRARALRVSLLPDMENGRLFVGWSASSQRSVPFKGTRELQSATKQGTGGGPDQMLLLLPGSRPQVQMESRDRGGGLQSHILSTDL